MLAHIEERNMKASLNWPFVRESKSDWWIPLPKGQYSDNIMYMEKVSIWQINFLQIQNSTCTDQSPPLSKVNI